MWGHSLTELFFKGGVVMWPLLFCSILGLALILERSAVIIWGGVRFHRLVDRLKALVKAGKIGQARTDLARMRGPVARTAAVYLEHLDSPPELREEVVAREASQMVAGLERRLNWLGLLAQVAPLLGLLGTVLGLMNAFYQIDLKGSQVQATDLAVGIWQKLLNTAFGMAIAIPCLMAYFWLSGRVNLTALQMEWMASYLKEWTGKAARTDAPENGAAKAPAGKGAE